MGMELWQFEVYITLVPIFRERSSNSAAKKVLAWLFLSKAKLCSCTWSPEWPSSESTVCRCSRSNIVVTTQCDAVHFRKAYVCFGRQGWLIQWYMYENMYILYLVLLIPLLEWHLPFIHNNELKCQDDHSLQIFIMIMHIFVKVFFLQAMFDYH